MLQTIKTWMTRAAYAAVAISLLVIAYLRDKLTLANQQVQVEKTKEEMANALQQQAQDQVATQSADDVFNNLAAKYESGTKPKQ